MTNRPSVLVNGSVFNTRMMSGLDAEVIHARSLTLCLPLKVGWAITPREEDKQRLLMQADDNIPTHSHFVQTGRWRAPCTSWGEDMLEMNLEIWGILLWYHKVGIYNGISRFLVGIQCQCLKLVHLSCGRGSILHGSNRMPLPREGDSEQIKQLQSQ